MAAPQKTFDVRSSITGIYMDVLRIEEVTDTKSRICGTIQGLNSSNSRHAREVLKGAYVGVFVGLTEKQIKAIPDYRTLYIDRALADLSEIRQHGNNLIYHAPVLKNGLYLPDKVHLESINNAEAKKRTEALADKNKLKPKFQRPEEKSLTLRWNIFYLNDKINSPLTAALTGHDIMLTSYIPLSQISESRTMQIPLVETADATSYIFKGNDPRPAKAIFGNPSFGDACFKEALSIAASTNAADTSGNEKPPPPAP